MPSWNIPIKDPVTGQVIGLACGRGRRNPPCKTCKSPEAKLACDGCDEQVCSACSVSPRRGLDFCPKCFKPAWDYWLKHYDWTNGNLAAASRVERRVAFRAWAKDPQGREMFLKLTQPRSPDSLKESP